MNKAYFAPLVTAPIVITGPGAYVTRIEKYRRVVGWALARYTDRRTHLLVLDTAGVKSTYSRIEDAAFAKYMALPRDASGALIHKGTKP